MKLTERELEIIRLIADDLTNHEIGAKLYITENTVKTRIRILFAKTECKGRAGLVAYGFRNGLIT